MKPLIYYITEAAGGGPYNYTLSNPMDKNALDHKSTPDDAYASITEKDYIDLVCSVIGKDAENNKELRDFISGAFNIWVDEFGKAKQFVPFRFNKSNVVKLCRLYLKYKEDNVNKNASDSFKIGKVRMDMGNGLGRGQGGYKFEDDMLSALCQYVLNGCVLDEKIKTTPLSKQALAHVDKSELKEKLLKIDWKTTVNASDIADAATPDQAVQLLADYISKTGAKDTRRHIANIVELPDVDLPIDDKQIQNLEDTGSTISDITFKTTEGEVYISLKNGAAQLSGVTISPLSKNSDNKWLEAVLDGKFNDTQNNIFNSYFSMLGLDPNQIKERFSKIDIKADETGDNKLSIKNYDPQTLGAVIQKLIGGNYWYVTPSHCFFVPAKEQNWKFEAEAASHTNRQIKIIGNIDGIRTDIVVRTSSYKTKYPNRMFPVVNLDKLVAHKAE